MTTFEQSFDDFATRYLTGEAGHELRCRVAGLARFAEISRDQTLLVDDHIEQFVFIREGATKLVAHASHSRDQIVAFHFAGDVVSIPARMHHSYSICALRDATVIAFPGDRFLDIARENAGVIGRLFAASSTSLLRCREKTVTLGRKSASERIASFLLAMAERIGTPVERGISLDLPMSRRDIADSLGLTIETVSRQLTLLREQSLIETVGRSGILLLDPNRLEDCAGYLSAAA
ncbi:helix-turn-helix domain-containing protein [Qipengyuania sp. RANM35]|uniref:helix-turn-helix domain-containing protein n=1 Tax=Qipengyuania sp. RANM35 TaxID=3068635 RepID=UPI0034DB0ECB